MKYAGILGALALSVFLLASCDKDGLGDSTSEGSGDITKWNTYEFGSTNIYSVGYANGKFFAGCNGGEIAYSEDSGETWTAVTSSPFWGFDVYGFAYDGTKYVAVGGDPSAKIAYSEDGITWTAVNSDFGIEQFNAVAYGNNTFVAVGHSDVIAYSEDGVAWTTVSASIFGSSIEIWSVAFGGGKFVAVSAYVNNSAKIAHSADGKTWTVVGQRFDPGMFCAVAYGDGKFVAVGQSGLGKIASSTDGGVSWTEVAIPVAEEKLMRCITYGGGKFVAGNYAGDVAYSTDVTTWNTLENSESFVGTLVHGIAYGDDGKFVIVGNDGKVAVSQ